MKKLIMAAAIVCAAAFAQAATVDWSIEGSTNPWTEDDIQTSSDGFQAYFFIDSATLGGNSTTLARMTALASLAGGDFSFITTKNVGAAGSFNYGEAGVIGVGDLNNGTDDTHPNVVNAYVVILGKDDDGANRAYITDLAETEINNIGGSTTLLFGDICAQTGVANNWFTATAVPEPTSGLLLLIGMAGLALRRRRA